MQTLGGTTDNMESKEYRIQRLSAQNLGDLEQLHNAVYGALPPKEYYFKKYNTAYTGNRYVGFIAYNAVNEPMAYYGVLPCYVRFGDITLPAAQSADTMTSPLHRNKGMFMDLSNRTFQLCRELGIKLVFGFPNQNSYHGAMKLGWKMTESLDCFIIKVNTPAVRTIAMKFPFLKNLNAAYRNRILKSFQLKMTGLPNSAMVEGYAGVWRNEEYLQYKTYSKTWVIQLSESRIWLTAKENLVIGDMENVHDKNFGDVMKQVQMLAEKLGSRQVQFHVSPGTKLHQLFLANYQPSPSFPALFQDFGSVIPPGKIKFTFADIDIF